MRLFFCLIGQAVWRGSKEQGNQRRNRRLKAANRGLYRVFYVSKDWFIFCLASIFVVFTTHLFKMRNTSSTLWIFQFFCYKCTCAGFTCGSPPSPPCWVQSIWYVACQCSFCHFWKLAACTYPVLRKHVSMHRSFIPAYFIVGFEKCSCEPHLLTLNCILKKKRGKKVAQGLIKALAVILQMFSADLLPTFC